METPAPSAPATGLAGWKQLSWSVTSLLPRQAYLNDLIATKDGYVLVGFWGPDSTDGRHQAAIWYSPDLVTWSRKLLAGPPPGFTEFTRVVALGGSLFATGTSIPYACGAPMEPSCPISDIIVWTSRDGLTWSEVTGPETPGRGEINDIIVGTDGLLAVGNAGWNSPQIWRSQDGRHWRAEELPASPFHKAHLFAVVATPGGWVVAGMRGGKEPVCCAWGWGTETTQAVWWSADGETWHVADLAEGLPEYGGRLASIFMGADGLAAADDGDPFGPSGASGETAQVWISDDGKAWTPTTVETASALRPIASDGATILGMTTSGDVATSRDGTNWQPIAATGDPPGTHASMSWTSMNLTRLVPDGLVLIGRGGDFDPKVPVLLGAAH